MATYNIDKFTSPSGDVYKFQDKVSGFSKVSVTPTLSSGTKIGTITVDGTGKDLYCQTNTNLLTGVKGDAEGSYRTGNVNLTPANIGAVNKSGDTMTGNLVAPAIRSGKTYYNICQGRTTATPVETILYTGIKWVSSSHMPVLHITGYAYGLKSPVEFKIGFYIYGGDIGWCGAQNMGAWNPDIYLFKYTKDTQDYVALGLKGQCYFLQLSVDVQDERGGFNNIDTNPSSWSWSFLTTTGTIPEGTTSENDTCVKVTYKDNYNPKPILTIQGQGTTIDSYNGTTAKTINITKSSLGLGNVDNTADANKNVATATKATQDESGNNIKASYAASMSISDHTITLKNKNGTSLGTVTVPDNNTTYTFAGGTNKFTVTPSGGTAQDVTVTPSIANNVTGSGTSGYLAKFNGANTITSGPALGTGTTTYLRNDGNWATPTDTTYSAGTGISLSGTTFSNSGVRSIATGSTNGTISVNTGGTSADIAVKGLGSAAYTASTDYATSDHTHSYLPLTGGTVSGSIAISTVGRGFNLTDSSGTTYGGLYENGDNLWIGAASSSSPHHRGTNGNTYISTGYNNTNSAGNSTIWIWVPTLSGTTWGGTSYGVLHSGNYSNYALPLSGGTLTGNLVIGSTSDTVGRNLTIRNSLGNVALSVGTDGAHGIYSNTKGGWLLYADKNTNSTNSNLYIPRSLIVGGQLTTGGKGTGTDGKAGTILSSTGNLYLQHTSGSNIYFFYGTSTSSTSRLYESASGTLTASGNWDVGGKMHVTGNIISSAHVSCGGKESGGDGNPGCFMNNSGSFFITGGANTGGTIFFHYNKATSNTSKIYESASGTIKVDAILWGKNASGGSHIVVTTVDTDTQKVAYLSTNASALYVNARHGGASYANKSVTLSSSDVRLKTNIKDTKIEALPVINQIQVREFDWIDEHEEKYQPIGMIADEIEKLDKRLAVGGGYDEDGCMNIKSVDTFYLTGYLTKGIQELSKENEELKKRIKKLETTLSKISVS